MKSLDITSPSRDLDFSSDRQVTIKFVGGTRKDRLRIGYTYTVSVPYSSFSQRIREIHRSGGKIIDVAISCFEVAVSPTLEIVVAEELVERISIDEVASLEPENPENQVEVIETTAIAPEVIEEITETIVEVEKSVTVLDSAPAIATKPKSSRASSKTGSGFNKSKAEAKTTRSSKKSEN